MRAVQWICGVLLAGCLVCAVVFRDSAGHPAADWLMLGVTIVLAGATLHYAGSTVSSLRELQLTRKNAIMPIVSIRYIDDRGANGPYVIFYRKTFLINEGNGVAKSIRVWSNLPKSLKKPIAYSSVLSPWTGQELAFGVFLGSNSGDLRTQINFITDSSTSSEEKLFTPILEQDSAIIVSYEDIYGQLYATSLKACTQKLHGPFDQAGLEQLKTELTRADQGGIVAKK